MERKDSIRRQYHASAEIPKRHTIVSPVRKIFFFLLEQTFKIHTTGVKKTLLTLHTSRRIQIRKYGNQTTVYNSTVSWKTPFPIKAKPTAQVPKSRVESVICRFPCVVSFKHLVIFFLTSLIERRIAYVPLYTRLRPYAQLFKAKLNFSIQRFRFQEFLSCR